jgi:hypothetical protein
MHFNLLTTNCYSSSKGCAHAERIPNCLKVNFSLLLKMSFWGQFSLYASAIIPSEQRTTACRCLKRLAVRAFLRSLSERTHQQCFRNSAGVYIVVIITALRRRAFALLSILVRARLRSRARTPIMESGNLTFYLSLCTHAS